MAVRELCLHLTRRCNQACVHCYYNSSPGSAGDIDIQTAKDLIFQAKQAEVRRITLQGGEPMLYDGLKELCEFSKKHGLIVAVVSNGQLISSETINWMKDLVDIVFISIHGDEKYHDNFVCSRGAFDLAIKAVIECSKEGIKTGVLTSVTEDNKEYVSQLTKLLDKHGVDVHGIIYHSEVGRGQSLKSMNIEKWEHFVSKMRAVQHSLIHTRLRFEALRQPVKSENFRKTACVCLSMEKNICFVDTDGGIYPCSLLINNQEACYGKISNVTLTDYFNNIGWGWAHTHSSPSQECVNCEIFDVCHGGCIARRILNKKNPCEGGKYLPTCVLYPDIDLYEEIISSRKD